MSRPEFIDECIECGKKIHNTDCRFFLCPECREKEKSEVSQWRLDEL